MLDVLEELNNLNLTGGCLLIIMKQFPYWIRISRNSEIIEASVALKDVIDDSFYSILRFLCFKNGFRSRQ